MHFNSTMVRLKVSGDPFEKVGEAVFQFHYGSVKSSSFALRLFAYQYFNSTMVRLKDDLDKLATTLNTNFNSTMVRLKALRDNHF